MNNPFIFERPIEPDKFIGRKRELRRLLATIDRSGSLVVTGQPRIGKTSLLEKMLDDIALRSDDEGSLPIPILMTSGHLASDMSQSDFWNYVINFIAETLKESLYEEATGSWWKLDRYFRSLDATGKRFVLVIDGAGWLLDNQKLGIPFWGGLRSLMAHHRALGLIMFSRLRSSQIQEQIEKGQHMGSPMMNFALEIALAPFSYGETMQLIQNYTGENENLFTPKDKRIVWQLSGGYPFLVQLAASVIWEARANGQSIAKDSYRYLKDVMLEIAHPHFWDVWHHLSPTAQAIGLMVTLREIATHRRYNTLDLDEALKTCEMDIRALKRTGLLLLNNHAPVLSSLSFGMWILRTQVGSGMEIPQPEEWLRQNQKIFGPATRKQIDFLARSVGKVYTELRASIIDLGEALARARFGL